MKKLLLILLLLANPVLAANTPPPGVNGQLIYNNNNQYGALSSSTLASYAAHNAIENGLSYDPRDPAYGAICGGVNVFTSNGSTKTFTYTIPFTGSGSTDNSNFMVFYEPADGSGSATILNTSQFTVTGVNSGGGTITLNSAAPNTNLVFVLHDDAAGFAAASTASVASGGYISVPDNCTIYGSQSNGTQLADGAQLIGQNFTPNYAFTDVSTKPVVTVIAPTGSAPNFGFNVTNKSKQFFEGFEITSYMPSATGVAYQTVPVLIGANGASGAGGGQSPGIVVQYMDINHGRVGFGAPTGGNSAYIFAVSRFNNYIGNYVGIYGPLSDFQTIGDDFSSNDGIAGMVVGPQQGAAGFAGASRVEYDRFEFNLEGIQILDGAVINLEGNQFDGNTNCGLDLNTSWNDITLTGGWFRGNANGGYSTYPGNTTAGQDAHICFNSGSGSGGLHISNVDFLTNYGEGHTAPLGSTNATSPPYVFDFNSAAANNSNITIDGGEAQFITGNSGASVTDFAIYRQGRPSGLKINTAGQAQQGTLVSGANASQARGLAANSWSAYYVVGDAGSYNNQYTPLSAGYGGIVGKNIGVGPTYIGPNVFNKFDCDVVNSYVIPNINFQTQDNGVVTWLPSSEDPGWGNGSYTNHKNDTSVCRLGALSWMAIAQQFKVYAQSGCTQTGTWVNDTSYQTYYGVKSQTNGSTLACNITTYGGPIYLWFQINENNGGTFTYQLDSGPTTTIATQLNNALNGQSFGGIRIPVNSSGAHTVNVAVTSTTSASNTVTIEGLGSPSGNPYHGSSPAVYLGGQVLAGNNSPQSAAVAAFNADQQSQAQQLAADGLSVGFANVQAYLSNADYTSPTSNSKLNAQGQGHVADAFSGVMQYIPQAANYANPLDYGAACNTQYFAPNGFYGYPGEHAVSMTAGSNVISINNYTFQPGVATQNGGGDVGKLFVGARANCGPTTYIASVNTSTNQATLGNGSWLSSANTCTQAFIGGYPSNPNDPSTAQDDTIAIQNAGTASLLGGGKVFLPPNCMVHNLSMPGKTVLEGSQAATIYSNNGATQTFSGYPNFSTTPLFMGMTGYADDVDGTSPRNIGINISSGRDISFKNMLVVCADFPFNQTGLMSSAFGTLQTTSLDPRLVSLKDVSTVLCPVGFGTPLGWNQAVSFTGSITDNGNGTGNLYVSAVGSTNFANYGESDFLAVGRVITVPGGTTSTIIAAPSGNVNVGTYTVNVGQTIGTESMSSAADSYYMTGTIQDSQFMNNLIGVNGSLTDFNMVDDIFTNNYNVNWYLGPHGGGAGTSSNHMVGGRFESGGIGVFIDSTGTNDGDDQFTGVQWQATLCAIQTTGGWRHIQVTGGWMQGNDCVDGSHFSQVLIGGSGTGFDMTGVNGDYINNGGAGTPTDHNSDYFIAIGTSSTSDYISVVGGDNRLGGQTGYIDYTYGTKPTHLKIDVAGIPSVDTTQTTLNIGYNGYIGIGTSASASPLNLTGLGTSAPIGTSATGYLCIDSSNNVYRKASCP